jgi:hypothetical protein
MKIMQMHFFLATSCARRCYTNQQSAERFQMQIQRRTCMLEFPSLSSYFHRESSLSASRTVPGQGVYVIKGYERDDVWRGYSRRANMKHTPAAAHCTAAADTIFKIFLRREYISALKFEQSPLSSSDGTSRSEIRHRCLRWSIGWHWRGWNERAGLWPTESRAQREREGGEFWRGAAGWL